MKEDHEQAIEEKGAAIALLNDDLKNREYENVALQAQRDVYQAQARDRIINLHVPRAKDEGKDNIVMIIEKNTAPKEDEFYEYPYYIVRIQRWFINIKRLWFKAQYPHHRFIMEELDNANSIHAFNRFEEKEYVERLQCHFRLVDFHMMPFMPWPRLPSRNKIFHDLNEIMKKLMSTSLMWVNCFSLIKNVRDKHAKVS